MVDDQRFPVKPRQVLQIEPGLTDDQRVVLELPVDPVECLPVGMNLKLIPARQVLQTLNSERGFEIDLVRFNVPKR